MMFFAGALLSMGAGQASAASATASHSIDINVNEVALLALDDTATLVFGIGAPTKAGEAFSVTQPADAVKYLQYTSIVEEGKTRKITAQLSTDMPAGLELAIDATSASKCGFLGSAIDVVLETAGSIDLVTGIGSGYTGATPDSDGVKLQYGLKTIECNDACDVAPYPGQPITITYTLTEGA
jgi:hypothetical protein